MGRLRYTFALKPMQNIELLIALFILPFIFNSPLPSIVLAAVVALYHAGTAGYSYTNAYVFVAFVDLLFIVILYVTWLAVPIAGGVFLHAHLGWGATIGFAIAYVVYFTMQLANPEHKVSTVEPWKS